MRITARELNRSTLARQLLLERETLGVADAVRRVVALQAQQPASPYLALWNRLTGFDPADLDTAFAGHEVVKSTLMRITLHAVHVDDFRAFHEAVQPSLRAARLGDRFTVSGLTAEDADALVPELLAFADRPRTAAEYVAWLEQRLGAPPKPGAWWGLRQYTPLLHAPTTPPWSFGSRPSYVAPPTRPVLADPAVSAASLQTLVLRYLEGFGPASVADVAHLSSVESQLPYVLVNLDARRRALHGTQQQVPPGSAIRNHLRRHRAAGDCRLHRIPTGRFPSPVTTHPDPCAPPRNATTGTAPSGGRHPARDRDNPLAENRPTKTTAHAVRTPTGMRHRSPAALERDRRRTASLTYKSSRGRIPTRSALDQGRGTGRGARPGTPRASSAPGSRHGE